jgi:hypothetical protein
MVDEWSFLSNHGYVLLALARQPDVRIRDIAALVGITERAAQGIVNALVEAGYVERVREGRRNRYLVHGEMPLRHDLAEAYSAAHLIGALTSEVRTSPREADCRAIVLFCSDYRFQEGLRLFLAAQGLLGGAEIVLWPGGGAALRTSDRDALLRVLEQLARERNPERLLLLAHQDCSAPGISMPPRSPSASYRALVRERRTAMQTLRRRIGLSPELWFIDLRRTRRVVLHAPAGRSRTPV